ncbi:MAG: beta-lactamase family protein [Bacteroidia bacterium]|nr:beta-lactamase family protein [Bacteroidia bacterium]MBT8276869.1 beta-lactamase family protein [Bacteroidia bacterium]NNF31019.1 serine hydrolase [Flavobacteriaceae bacterium]NNK53087.1 serine hydrolase [Flavobacteriaceae bacterium]NNM08764.1 serine hydrolase [Flavobacteriaceae bacterium]
MRFLSILLFSIFLIPIKSDAQILEKIKKTKDKISAVTIDKLSRDPITTSFKDVDKSEVLGIEFGNDRAYQSFFEQLFDPNRGFTLEPGYYEGTFQSFCIKAGTTPPVEGGGRFYAPIKGPKADIMTAIIDGYQGNPEITQREVQLLLWAIIAKADFTKMKGPVKVTAIKLLTPSQIARLSKGALDKLTRNELKKVANETPAVRAILEAEDNLRRKFYAGAKSYQEYEEIAMLAGVEPIVPGFEAGRWTKHPEGYYIRYFPKGYAQTRTQIYIPESTGTTQFNPSTDIAVPPNRGQRLLQTNLPTGNPSSNTGGYVNTYPDPFCEPAFDPIVDNAVRKQMIMQNVPGLAVAVFKEGKMIHIKGYGYSNYYSKTPITTGTKMHWASISKSVTGVAAAQLEERGINNFSVNDKITEYVDRDTWDKVKYTDTTGIKSEDKRPLDITLGQLLNNTSGIQHYGKGSGSGDDELYAKIPKGDKVHVVAFERNTDAYGDRDNGPRGWKAKEAVDIFNMSVLNDDPGMRYLYSSYGFVLAGAAVDKVSPDGYHPWVKENIIKVADLRSMDYCEEKGPGHHMNQDGMLITSDLGCNQPVLPAGGYESNICDLAKYAYALSTGKFLDSNKTVLWDNMVTVSRSSSDATRGYSYGLNFEGTGKDLRVWHGGKHNNVRSHMEFFPADSTGIVLIAPAVYSELPRLARYIRQELSLHPESSNINGDTPRDRCRSNMENGEDLFHGVWRKTSDDVLIRTGYEKRGFFNQMGFLKNNGYEVVDIETYKNGGKRYWDAVLKEGQPDSKLVSDLKLSELKDKINSMKGNGYIVTDIESYIAGNSGRLWGAVFSKENKRNKTAFKMTRQEFLDQHQANVANGYALADVESYPAGNVFHWTGVWVEGGQTKLEVNKKPKDLFDEMESMRNQSYRISDVEYYMLSNQEWRVAVVWEKSTDDEFITGEVADLDGDGDDDGGSLTLHEFCDHMSEHELLSSLGYELIDWERIDIEWFDD